MKSEEKQALIETALRIKRARNIYGSDITDVKALCEIALASLTAQPVKLPQIREWHRGCIPCVSVADVKSALRAAGYQVEE